MCGCSETIFSLSFFFLWVDAKNTFQGYVRRERIKYGQSVGNDESGSTHLWK